MTAHPDPVVLASIETDDGAQCVDFFPRVDGTFGFEQYRSDYDAVSRWQRIDVWRW
jgi:hypothetical protein